MAAVSTPPPPPPLLYDPNTPKVSTTIVFANADYVKSYVGNETSFEADFVAAFLRVTPNASVSIKSVTAGSIIVATTIAFPQPAAGVSYSCSAAQAWAPLRALQGH